jgi:hypothetical protein
MTTQTQILRLFCSELVTIRWQESWGASREQTGVLEELWPSGAGVSVDMPVPAGADIRLTARNRDYFGSVRNCEGWASGYSVGLEWREGCAPFFVPQHLMDPGRIRRG